PTISTPYVGTSGWARATDVDARPPAASAARSAGARATRVSGPAACERRSAAPPGRGGRSAWASGSPDNAPRATAATVPLAARPCRAPSHCHPSAAAAADIRDGSGARASRDDAWRGREGARRGATRAAVARERGRLGTLPRRLEPDIAVPVEPVTHERPVEVERRLAKVVRMVRQDGLRIEPEVEVEGVSVVEALEADVRGQRQRLLHVTGTKEEIDVVHRSIVGAPRVAPGQHTALEGGHRDPA